MSFKLTEHAPYTLFVDKNNTLYALSRQNDSLLIFHEGSNTTFREIVDNITDPINIFVSDDSIFISNYDGPGNIFRWSLNATIPELVISFSWGCNGLFIDSNNSIYCSRRLQHQVQMRPLDNNASTSITVAGNGCAGSSLNKLIHPEGIFVHENFSLYVADSGNDRIQHFLPGQKNATTVAGYGAPDTITLYSPRDVKLDKNNYLFIVDTNNDRIVGSGPNGFRCIVGCSTSTSNSAQRLNLPRSMYFDTYGNILTLDSELRQIRKFLLATNHCSECPENFVIYYQFFTNILGRRKEKYI